MNTYISLNEVLVLAQKALDCHLKQVPRKKILFQGIVNTGETLTLCSPQSKMHPQGFYWVAKPSRLSSTVFSFSP